MGEMKFSGLVNIYIDGLNLSEFGPEIAIEHNDTEPIGKVVKSFETDEGFTCTIEPKDMKAFRKIVGFPAEPIRHKKLNRKSFKKAIMAWRVQRNEAEKICDYIANTPFWGCGYDYYAKRLFDYMWR